MTHEETIKALDKLIVYLNACVVKKDITKETKYYVINSLPKDGISNTIIPAINSIEIRECVLSFLADYNSDFRKHDNEIFEKNKTAICSVIDILTIEKERIERLVDNKERERANEEQRKNAELQQKTLAEQKKSNEIQYKAFWCSIVATIASIIATIVSIIALILAL